MFTTIFMTCKNRIYLTFFLLVLSLSGCKKADYRENNQLNIVVVIVDQLSAEVMGNSGCSWVKTPAMDQLASEGMKFTNAYTPFPLCSPTRAAFLTGQYPFKSFDQVTKYKSLGTILKGKGYQTEYIGKWHVGNTRIAKNKKVLEWSGFDSYQNGDDEFIENRTTEFLKGSHEDPFFLLASFMNPHDCCELARKIGGWEIRNTFEKGKCTPDFVIPENKSIPYPNSLDDPDLLPEVMENQKPLLGKNYVSIRPTGNWSLEDWQTYRHGYSQLVQCVDNRIGNILKTLKEQQLDDNTVVIFTSDHGDGIGEHGWNQKLAFYDEIIRVPFIIKAPSGVKGKVCDGLVNVGIDLLPTVLDYAGIEYASYPGESLKTPTTDLDETTARKYLVSELDLSLQGLGTDEVPEGADLDRLLRFESSKARMITDGRYKYITYNMGKNPEILFDLQSDPNETINLINHSNNSLELNMLKSKLQEYLLKVGDDF